MWRAPIGQLLGAALALAGTWVPITYASVQEPPAEPGQLDLARITVGEVGLQRVTDDAPAILAVLQRRAARQGRSWRRVARAYSGSYLDRSRDDARSWVAWLRPDGRRPAMWPRGPSWDRRTRVWLDVYSLSGRALRGDVLPSCEPDHYGSPDPRLPDIHRARAAGWKRISCGDTVDAYWHCPRGVTC